MAKALSSENTLKQYLEKVKEEPNESIDQSFVSTSVLMQNSKSETMYAILEEDGQSVRVFVDDKPFLVRLQLNELDILSNSMMSGANGNFEPRRRSIVSNASRGPRNSEIILAQTLFPALSKAKGKVAEAIS